MKENERKKLYRKMESVEDVIIEAGLSEDTSEKLRAYVYSPTFHFCGEFKKDKRGRFRADVLSDHYRVHGEEITINESETVIHGASNGGPFYMVAIPDKRNSERYIRLKELEEYCTLLSGIIPKL